MKTLLIFIRQKRASITTSLNKSAPHFRPFISEVSSKRFFGKQVNHQQTSQLYFISSDPGWLIKHLIGATLFAFWNYGLLQWYIQHLNRISSAAILGGWSWRVFRVRWSFIWDRACTNAVFPHAGFCQLQPCRVEKWVDEKWLKKKN